MALRAAGFAFINGRIPLGVLNVGLPVGFNGGTPATATGRLAVTDAIPTAFLAGLPYDTFGRMSIAVNATPPVRFAPNGIPIAANGAVQCDNVSPITAWAPGGIPITSTGGMAVT